MANWTDLYFFDLEEIFHCVDDDCLSSEKIGSKSLYEVQVPNARQVLKIPPPKWSWLEMWCFSWQKLRFEAFCFLRLPHNDQKNQDILHNCFSMAPQVANDDKQASHLMNSDESENCLCRLAIESIIYFDFLFPFFQRQAQPNHAIFFLYLAKLAIVKVEILLFVLARVVVIQQVLLVFLANLRSFQANSHVLNTFPLLQRQLLSFQWQVAFGESNPYAFGRNLFALFSSDDTVIGSSMRLQAYRNEIWIL